MKQIILIILTFVSAAAIFAQPPSSKNDGRLQTDLKRLEKKFEIAKEMQTLPDSKNNEVRKQRTIESAESELAGFKERHPDYDVSGFENDITNLKNGTSNSVSSNTSAATASTGKSVSDFQKIEDVVNTIDEIIKFTPDATAFIGKEDGALEKNKQLLKDFQQKMNQTITPEFIRIASDTSNRKIQRAAEKASRSAESIKNQLAAIQPDKIKQSSERIIFAGYFKVVFFRERLKQLQKIYGDSAEIKSANETGDKLLAELGTIEDIQKQNDANIAAQIAKTTLYPARQNNPALVKDFIRAFKASPFTQKDFANSEILKVNLTGSDWSVERNKITGIILSRDQQANFAIKTPDGKCFWYLALFEQKHQGGGKYGGTYLRSGSRQEMLCENVSK